MKRGLVLALILAGIVTLSVFFLGFTGRVMLNPSIPTNCTDANLTLLWNSIFKDSAVSSQLNIFGETNQDGRCNNFTVFRVNNNKFFIMTGSDWFYPSTNISWKYIIAATGNLTQNYSNVLGNITGFRSQTQLSQENPTFIPVVYLTKRDLSIIDSNTIPLLEFSENFKYISAPPWDYETTLPYVYKWRDHDNETSINTYNMSEGNSFVNYSLGVFIYQSFVSYNPPACTPNWTSYNTSCIVNERKTEWFIDSANCGISSGRPSNITHHCDYNDDGVIGNFSALPTNRVSLSVYVNGTLGNNSKSYKNTGIQKIEFKNSGGDAMVEFYWNFSYSPLDLDNVFVEKQSSSFGYGYLVVKGLELNKKILVDKVNVTDTICVKDSQFNSIDDFTWNCSGVSEYRIDCPGNYNSTYNCTITGGYFLVVGLSHSGVKQLIAGAVIVPTNCTLNWSCISWSVCSSNVQTRTCNETNRCNLNNLTRIESQACIIHCNADWNCSEWKPAECPKDAEQTRTCNDLNKCNVTSTNKKTEAQECEYESKTNFWIILIILIVFAVLVVAFLIIYLVNKSKKSADWDQNVKFSTTKSSNQSPPYQGYQQPK